MAERISSGIGGLINPRSQVFKKMKVNLEDFADHEVIELIQENPRIMYRPVLTHKEAIALGFDIDKFKEVLS